MGKDTYQYLLWSLVFWCASVVCASTGIPELSRPLERVAETVTGPLAVSGLTIAVIMTGLYWRLGGEYGTQSFFGMGTGAGLTLGGGAIVRSFGGGASGATLTPDALMPLSLFWLDACGELLGWGIAALWLWCAVCVIRHTRGLAHG